MTDFAALIVACRKVISMNEQEPESQNKFVKKTVRSSSRDTLSKPGTDVGGELDEEQLRRVAGGYPPNPCDKIP
jgi:hypothetical protein